LGTAALRQGVSHRLSPTTPYVEPPPTPNLPLVLKIAPWKKVIHNERTWTSPDDRRMYASGGMGKGRRKIEKGKEGDERGTSFGCWGFGEGNDAIVVGWIECQCSDDTRTKILVLYEIVMTLSC